MAYKCPKCGISWAGPTPRCPPCDEPGYREVAERDLIESTLEDNEELSCAVDEEELTLERAVIEVANAMLRLTIAATKLQQTIESKQFWKDNAGSGRG